MQKKNDSIDSKIKFLNLSKNLKDVFAISSGVSGLKFLIEMYGQNMGIFKGQGKKYPVVMLLDSDSGSKTIKNIIRGKLGIKKLKSQFYNIVENLYVIFVSDAEEIEIENLFDRKTLKIKLDGKVLNLNQKINSKTEYGKNVFAEKVIKLNQKNINFNNFKSILNKFKIIINDHSKKFSNKLVH